MSTGFTRAQHAIAHLATSITTVLVTLGAMQTNMVSGEAAQIEVAYARIQNLEEQLARQTGQLIIQATQITELQLLLERKFDAIGYLKSYIEAIKSPAWVKVYDPADDVFRTLLVNSAYGYKYGYSPALMIGATDDEVWPEKQATEYEENDRQVLKYKNFARVSETVVLPDGEEKTQRFWKFYLKLPDGRQAVAGLEIGN